MYHLKQLLLEKGSAFSLLFCAFSNVHGPTLK